MSAGKVGIGYTPATVDGETVYVPTIKFSSEVFPGKDHEMIFRSNGCVSTREEAEAMVQLITLTLAQTGIEILKNRLS